jgi:hypothetical protein
MSRTAGIKLGTYKIVAPAGAGVREKLSCVRHLNWSRTRHSGLAGFDSDVGPTSDVWKWH